MKLFFLLSAFVFLLNSIVVAQKRKTYTINPGVKATEVIPTDEIFLYPNFTPGTVYYKTGPYSSGLLNYNFLITEIQFIDPKGDTLSLADEITIDYIAFTRDTFYYDNGYLKFIRNCGEFKLAQKQFFVITNKEKIGAMGIKTSSSSIDTYTRLPGNNRFKSNGLVAQEVLTLARNDLYYFGDKFNHFKRLNKKNLIEAYPAKGKEIRDYFKENSLKEITEEDMVKLMESLSDKKQLFPFTISFTTKLKYLHHNPVSGKWKLVIDFTDYEHSSASFYETGVVKGYEPFDYRLLQSLTHPIGLGHPDSYRDPFRPSPIVQDWGDPNRTKNKSTINNKMDTYPYGLDV